MSCSELRFVALGGDRRVRLSRLEDCVAHDELDRVRIVVSSLVRFPMYLETMQDKKPKYDEEETLTMFQNALSCLSVKPSMRSFCAWKRVLRPL